MKKLLSFLAAGALALGLIGCSGDLHDMEPTPLGIVGVGTGSQCASMTIPEGGDGSIQTFSFTWSSDFMVKMMNGKEYPITGGWGSQSGGSGGFDFKLELPTDIADNGDAKWSKDYGAPSDDFFSLSMGSEFVPLLTRTDSGVSAAGPSNIHLSGLVDGENYIITVQYDSASEKVSVKASGVSADPTQFRIVFYTDEEVVEGSSYDYIGGKKAVNKNTPTNFPIEYLPEEESKKPAADQKTKLPIYAMAKEGNTYKYGFISLYDEELYYRIENDILGVVYTSPNKISLEKYKGYTIRYVDKFATTGANTSSVISDKSATEPADDMKLAIGKNPAIISDIAHNGDMYAELGDFAATNYITAKRESFDIYIQRASGSDSMVWASSTKGKSLNIANSSELSLEYIDRRGLQNLDGEEIKNYTAPAFYPVTITGLEKDKIYKIAFEDSGEAFAKKLTVEKAAPGNYNFAECILVGDVTGWAQTNDAYLFQEITDDDGQKSFYVDFVATSDNHQIKVKKNESGWDNLSLGGIDDNSNTLTVGDGFMRIKDGADSKNLKVSCDTGATYRVFVRNYDVEGFAYIKIKKIKDAENAPTEYSLAGLTLKGGWEGWWSDTYKLTDKAEQTFKTKVGEHDADGKEFGIFPDGKDNEWVRKNVPFGKRVEFFKNDGSQKNSTMESNWEVGATYTIKVELVDNSLDNPRVFITVTKN